MKRIAVVRSGRSRVGPRARLVLVTVALVASPAVVLATEQSPVELVVGGVGLGVGVDHTSLQGTAVSSSARVHFRSLFPGSTWGVCPPGFHYNDVANRCFNGRGGESALLVRAGRPLLAAELDGEYNIIGLSPGGAVTGGRVRARVAIGGQMQGPSVRGCDFYVAAAFRTEGELNVGRHDRGALAAGPETGLFCQVGQTLLMLSPSVQAGISSAGGEAGGRPTFSSDPLLFSGRARLAVDDRFYLSAEATTAPVFPELRLGENRWNMIEGEVTADYRVSDRWLLNASARATRYDGTTEAAGDHTEVTASFSAIRAF